MLSVDNEKLINECLDDLIKKRQQHQYFKAKIKIMGLYQLYCKRKPG